MLSIIDFPSAFFLGRIAPALLRQASYGTIKIGIYQSLKKLFVERLEGQYKLLIFFGVTLKGIIEIMLTKKVFILGENGWQSLQGHSELVLIWD